MRWLKVGDYIRVSKRRAEKLYNDGEILYMCPYKLRPGEPWHPEVAVCLTDGEGAKADPTAFDSVVNTFEIYNCSRQAGEYVAFYMKEKMDENRV